tara:strand:+ start:673 stop:1125 length:453 start_codon:yes stop_codon:yes gene_type:complete
MSRRLINEQRINKWPPNWHFYKEDNIILVFIDTIYKNKTLILNIDTSNSYPFCPPKVTCDGIGIKLYYKDLFHTSIRSYEKDCMKLSDTSCWCCDTILCKDKWDNQKRIVDIVNEFKKFHHCKKRAGERYWCKLIAKYLLIEHLPIYEYL